MPESERFVAFSGEHWLILAVFVLGVVLLPRWGRSHRGTPTEVTVRRTWAGLLATVFLAMQVYYAFEPGGFRLGSSLPVELCDLAEMAAVVALWSRHDVATAFTYYVALTLSVQGILTPALGQSFPSVRYLGFWALHLMVVWAAVYLTWGLGFRPTWHLYRVVCVLALVWLVLAYALDRVLGTDYGYLVRKPGTASLLDLLGPWPWYVVAGLAVVLGGWALVLTLPWQLADRRAASVR